MDTPRFLRFGAITAALCILSGCRTDSSRSGSTGEGAVLHYSTMDEPRRLDPAFVKDLYEGVVSGWLYDGLTGFAAGTRIEPRLAERWDVSPDGRTYTFHLRDAFFSDGRPVRSADVRYSFERVLRPETGSDRKWVLDRIAGAQELTSGTTTSLSGLRTPDAHTVEITLSRPSPVFLTMLAMPTGSIIPEGSAGAAGAKPDPKFDEAPVGTGPWTMTGRERDRLLKFAPNQRFWGDGPKLDGLVCHIQIDDTVRRRQYEIGNFDIYQVGFQVWDAWSKDPARSRQLKSVQELRTDFLGFNASKGRLTDPRVRRALALGVDTGKIFERLQRGRGVRARGPVPPGVPGYRKGLAPDRYDPAAAAALLAEAGVKTQGPDRLKLEIWYRDEALNAEIVQSARADLEKLGVETTPVARDQAAFRAGIWSGAPDLFLGSWTLDYPDPENALAPTFHSRNIPRQGNQARFSDPVADRLIEAAEAETDPARRLSKWQAVEDRVIEQAPWIPLFHRKTYYAVQPEVKGWTPAVMYNADRFTETAIEGAAVRGSASAGL